MTLALEGKVAVVTGGASGVGLGIAQEFVDQGATVVITDLQQDQIDAAVAVIGPKASGVVADVSKLADMKAVYSEVIALHGRLDAVVANAGIGAHAPSKRSRKMSSTAPSISTSRASCSPCSRPSRCCPAAAPLSSSDRLPRFSPRAG